MEKVLWQELREWTGHPVRLSPVDGNDQLYGVMHSVDFHRCVIDLSDAPAHPLTGYIRAEVISSKHVLRFMTTGMTEPANMRRVTLANTDEIEVVQRRQHPRVSITLPVWFRSIGGPEGAPVIDLRAEQPAAYTMNLSAGGAGLRADNPVEKGTQVSLTLGVGDFTFATDIRGIVSRTEKLSSGGWFVAIQFQSLSPEVSAFLSELVVQRLEAAPGQQQWGRIVHTEMRPE